MENTTLILPTTSTISQMYTELGTSETKIDLDVKFLKEWMRKQPHLPNPDDDESRIDEKRIKTLLIMCKNSLEKTKVMLDHHYTIKLSVPEYFSKWDPTLPEIIQEMKQFSYVPLPTPTHEGHRVTLCYFKYENVDAFLVNEFAKIIYMSYDLRTAKLDTFNNNIFIFDFDNLSMNRVTAFLPIAKKYFESVLVAYPARVHEIHLLNIKSFVHPLINLLLSIIKKKIADRVINHKSIEELKNYIDPSILPVNYGGTYPKTSDEITDDWYDELIRHREWLMAQSSIVADNSKRPKNSNNNLDSIENAIEGSFRKLEVD